MAKWWQALPVLPFFGSRTVTSPHNNTGGVNLMMSAGAQSTSRRGRLLRAALVVVSTFAVLAGIFAFTLHGNGVNASVVSQVRDSFGLHLSNFDSENTTLLTRDYAPNATLAWVGTTRGLGGDYSGTAAIKQFYSTFFSKITNVSVKNATYTVRSVGGGATLNGTFAVLGGGPQSQTLSGEVMMSASYVRVNGEWVISSETWDFLGLSLQRPLD